MQVCHEVVLLICQSAQLEARARQRDTGGRNSRHPVRRLRGQPGLKSVPVKTLETNAAPKICPSGGPRAATIVALFNDMPLRGGIKGLQPPLQGAVHITADWMGNSRFEVVL